MQYSFQCYSLANDASSGLNSYDLLLRVYHRHYNTPAKKDRLVTFDTPCIGEEITCKDLPTLTERVSGVLLLRRFGIYIYPIYILTVSILLDDTNCVQAVFEVYNLCLEKFVRLAVVVDRKLHRKWTCAKVNISLTNQVW